jgi:hypothetical protein
MTLPAQDRAVLAFERLRWKNRGAKDTAVLVLFGMSWPAYVQTLHSILDKPEALEYDAELVNRLRRLREARRRDRSARVAGFEIP